MVNQHVGLAVRLAMFHQLREKGKSFLDSTHGSMLVTDDMIHTAAMRSGVTLPEVTGPVVDWLKAHEAEIFKLVLALLPIILGLL